MPPVHEENYDGWHLRLSNGRTKRINSVNFLNKVNETVALPEKISFCEQYYNKHQHPCRFRITSLSFLASLENALLNRGYQPIDKTDVLLQDLSSRPKAQPTMPVTFEKTASEEWLGVLCRLTGREGDAEKQSLKDTLARIEIDVCYASIRMDGEIVALVSYAPVEGVRFQLKRIYLSSKLRGTGMGLKLLHHVEGCAKTRGAAEMELWTDTRFTRAHSFYAREGYVKQAKTRDLGDISNTTEYQFIKLL